MEGTLTYERRNNRSVFVLDLPAVPASPAGNERAVPGNSLRIPQ